MRSTWRMLTGRRDLRLVLSAGIISLTGDWILTDRADLPGLRRDWLHGGVRADDGVLVRAAGAARRGRRGVRGPLGPQADDDRRRPAARGWPAAAAAGAGRGAGLDRLRGDVLGGIGPAVLLPRPAGHGAPAGARRRARDGQRGERPGVQRVPAGGFGARRHTRGGRRYRRRDAHRRRQLPCLRRAARLGQDERAHGLPRGRIGPGQAGSGRRRSCATGSGWPRGTGCCAP